MFFVSLTLTSSIPNSFSSEDLERLLENAPTEETMPTKVEDMDPEQIAEFATKLVDDSLQFCDGPLLHKVMALTIINRLIEWHTTIGVTEFENDSPENGVSWLRDAGKLQAALSQLREVGVGDSEFTVPEN